jgi:2,3,4,5-tetrahydropyridine-2-carboxylate N-succinyltransferase
MLSGVHFCLMDHKEIIEKAWEDRSLLSDATTQKAINEIIEKLDKGVLRVAEPTSNGWQVNDWVKKAVILYFPIRKMETYNVGPMEYHDKMALKNQLCRKRCTCGSACGGALWSIHFSKGVTILMPSLCKYWSLCR